MIAVKDTCNLSKLYGLGNGGSCGRLGEGWGSGGSGGRPGEGWGSGGSGSRPGQARRGMGEWRKWLQARRGLGWIPLAKVALYTRKATQKQG
ncbi:hypothetical protein OIU74_006306 [Salix koriyanagi]|uniref:Uncharacterized protein n=1 Tax=Salix koriyanagi TaxID=2511006 RepID=A0A9Q0UDW4_9ROSI|nr:hypothetical protein OIU74_006306 [Salix koriyanagi]